MTPLLDQVIEEISKLSAADQDALAAILLKEIAAEQRWSRSFAKAQDLLEKLAAEALEEVAADRTRPM